MPTSRPVESHTLRLEVLSPIHVGNGHVLQNDLDYVCHSGMLYVMDFERALPKFESSGLAFQGWAQLLKPPEYPSYARLTMPVAQAPSTVQSTFREPGGVPYLPGSTLKGALRTGILSALLGGRRDLLDRATRRPTPFAASLLERELLGRDPNHDLLRALHVGDLRATASSDAIVAHVALHSLRNGKLVPKGAGYRWDVEALKVGAVLEGALSIDKHLLSVPRESLRRDDPRAGLASSMARNRHWLGDDLFRCCSKYARHLVEAEIGFFERCGLETLAKSHRAVLTRLDDIRDNPRRTIIRLGWGTGWRAKTVSPQLEEDSACPLCQCE